VDAGIGTLVYLQVSDDIPDRRCSLGFDTVTVDNIDWRWGIQWTASQEGASDYDFFDLTIVVLLGRYRK
jgi:hypothetical protein